MRTSSTNAAISRMKATARLGIHWSKKLIAPILYSAASSMMPRTMQINPPAITKTRGKKGRGFFSEERVERREHHNQDADVSGGLAEQLLCLAFVHHFPPAVRGKSWLGAAGACNQKVARIAEKPHAFASVVTAPAAGRVDRDRKS